MTTLERIAELSNERQFIWHTYKDIYLYDYRTRLLVIDLHLKELWNKRRKELCKEAKLTHSKRSKYRDTA